MNNELEVHLGDQVYFLEIVNVIVENEFDKKGEPITKFAPRVFAGTNQLGVLLNRYDMPHFVNNDAAEQWAWDWVRHYHKTKKD